MAEVPATDAAAWANLNFLPTEAAPLVAEGITPDRAAAGNAAAVNTGPDAHLRAELLRRDDLLIDQTSPTGEA